MAHNETDSTPDTRFSQSIEVEQDIDSQSTDPADPVIKQSAAQRAAEAARVGLEDHSADIGATLDDNNDSMAAGEPTTGGDIDAMQEQAKVVGEEAVGGTTPTPDQSNVDDIGASMGLKTHPEKPLRVSDEMHRRDDQRFELDPDSRGPAASA